MYVRLAFAVAAHLDSDILIVDEVLAVGDAEFQKKCLGKMGEVSKGEGRTVIFVSHNLGSISTLCSNSVLLKNGQLDYYGNTESSINQYLKSGMITNNPFYQYGGSNRLRGYFSKIEIVDETNEQCAEFDVFDKVFININYKLLGSINSMHICVNMYKDGVLIWRTFDTDFNEHLLNSRNSGDFSYKLELPHLLKAGNYIFNFYIGIVNGEPLDKIEDLLAIEVIERSFDPSFKSFSKSREGLIVAQPTWYGL
jgi:lipopolysaccharide transport system ATP-binding protein